MATVNNHDIAGFARRINRFIDEVQHAASGAGSQVSSEDLARAQAYLGAMKTYHDHVIAIPSLDLPETHPLNIEVEEGPELTRLENESLTDLVYMFMLIREELLNSQSARLASGLIRYDSKRFLSIVEKANLFLTEYVAEVTPLDLPESSPLAASTGSGKKGI